jgi:undecaprenyl-diphosphatase
LNIIKAIVLGIIQGLTEFLPVSSSGHLVLFEQIFNITNDQLLFNIILHVGTLIAVLYVFKKQVDELIKNPLSKKAKMLMLSTIITLALAFVFKDFLKNAFNGGLLAFSFLVTATFLLLAEYIGKKQTKYKNLNYKNTAVMGIFQGLALIPGISRAGSTISSAVVQGVKREQAAQFSFLMSIPIILASLMYELIDIFKNKQTINLEAIPTTIGFLFAVVFGVIAIKIMLRVIERCKYSYFSVYLIMLSVFVLLNQYVFMWF